MSLTNKVLYDIDQSSYPSEQKSIARKNIGAYEDKTTSGGGTGIPKADLASDIQSSLGKADSSVQSVTTNGQSLTKSAAGAIDIPKATATKWGVVQVVNEISNNENVIPNSKVIKETLDELSVALPPKMPIPNSGVYLCGNSNGNMYWYKRKTYMYKTSLGVSGDGVHTITQTDIDNKYCDIPITWSTETDTYGLLNRADNFLFALTIDDMRLNRGSSNYPLNNIVSKIKCSLCDETRTWFSNDNAHGNDPHGMIFDDILGSELARVPGYPTLDKEVRRVAYGPNNLANFMGPSFRIMFSDTSTLAVGDKIEMDGIVSGIDFRNGGWGTI